MTDDANDARLRLDAIAAALSLGRIERHVFLCALPTTPKCATHEESERVWKHLKSRLAELGLDSGAPAWRGKIDGPPPPTVAGSGRVLRTKVDCLRVCEQGPIAVIYPEGIWYRRVTVEVMERIIVEHLIGGSPVEEYVFARSRQ